MLRPRPLRSRLLLAQTAAVVLLAAGVLAMSLWGARRAVRSVSRELVDRAALEVTALLENLYGLSEEHLDSLAVLAGEGLIRPDGDADDLRRLVLPWIDAHAGIGAIGLFDDSGQGVALRRSEDDWAEIVVRPSAGGAPPPGAGLGSDFDPRREPWWITAGAPDAGNPARWSERVEGGLSGEVGLSVSRRFATPRGEVRVAVFEFLLDGLLARLSDLKITPGTVIGVLDVQQRLVAWAGHFSAQGGAHTAGLFLRRPRELGVALFGDARGAFEAVEAARADEALSFESGGRDWWGRLRPFALPGGGVQMVAVLIPADDLFDERARLLWSELGLTAAAILLAIAGARAVARRVAEPVEALVVRSERIAGGDLEPEPPVPSDIAEVERLAEAQEAMRAGLKKMLKLERDLQIARQIQQATWPRELPSIPGLEIATSAHPADETGGDGYDLVPVPGEPAGRTFLFLADATGHGIGPALSVTQLRAMLRMAVRSGHGLDEIVEPVNAQLKADLPGNRFVTAWFGRLDADGRGLESLSAGQAPLVHYHAADDRLEVMKADLPPLGLFPKLPPMGPKRIELAPGDLWVVLSDGFYEAEDPAGEQLGVERIAEVLRRCRDRPATEILAEIRALLERFTQGEPAADDQTAILLRRT